MTAWFEVRASMQVASVMGLNSVALDLLLLIHPMSASQAEDQVLSSSRQDLKNDMQELESAGFVKPCKDTPDSWEFAQVSLLLSRQPLSCQPYHRVECLSHHAAIQWN